MRQLAALFNGISQFWYLYSPRKIDFYHSLPVKRSRMFWHKTLQSLLYYLLPYLAMEFFSVCIGAMRGFFSLHLMKLAFLMMVFHLLLYLLLYFSVVLVICITGHLLMGACFWWLQWLAYGPVLSVAAGVLRKGHFIIPRSVECLWLYKRLERNGVTSHPCLHLCGKICRRKLWWHSGNCASGDNALLAFLDITHLYTENPKEPGWPLFFHGLAQCSKISDCGSRRTWNRTYFLYAVQVTVPESIWWIFGLILGTLLSGGIMGIIYYRDFRKFFLQ